ncbi:MAG: SIMPL domain-containing protein [Propionibacteriaceae bacterium]|nr:SIMPL domain-containing protein [Propionibacteriaceae bacterium]
MGNLNVEAQHDVPVTATKACILLSIPASESVFGNAAVKKAAEVRTLTTELLAAGIGDEDIDVIGIRLLTESGKLTRNQRAEFQVRIRASAAQLGNAINIIADQPNVMLRSFIWNFDSHEAAIDAARVAFAKARQKAEAIAAAAGQRITGIANINDSSMLMFADEGGHVFDSPGLFGMRAAKAPDLGVDFASTRTLTVRLNVEFTIENQEGVSFD